eukprot:Gb_25410 [translate_table: standard]
MAQMAINGSLHSSVLCSHTQTCGTKKGSTVQEQLALSRMLSSKMCMFEQRKIKQERFQMRPSIQATSLRTRRIPRPDQEIIPVSPEDLLERVFPWWTKMISEDLFDYRTDLFQSSKGDGPRRINVLWGHQNIADAEMRIRLHVQASMSGLVVITLSKSSASFYGNAAIPSLKLAPKLEIPSGLPWML